MGEILRISKHIVVWPPWLSPFLENSLYWSWFRLLLHLLTKTLQKLHKTCGFPFSQSDKLVHLMENKITTLNSFYLFQTHNWVSEFLVDKQWITCYGLNEVWKVLENLSQRIEMNSIECCCIWMPMGGDL